MSFTIVGTTVLFPSPDSNSGDALVLGGGLLFTFDGVARMAGEDVDVDAGAGSLLVELRDGVDPDAFVERMDTAMAGIGLPGSVLAVGPTLPPQLGSPIEPAEVRGVPPGADDADRAGGACSRCWPRCR